MNISGGKILEKGREASGTDARKYLGELMSSGFTGYLAVASQGSYGMEEGIIVFDSGKIRACSYEYFTFSRDFGGEAALKRALNAMLNPKALIDSYSLMGYQVQLVATLNESHAFRDPIGQGRLDVPESFSNAFEEEMAKEEQKTRGPSREELLKKYNLVTLPRVGSAFKRN